MSQNANLIDIITESSGTSGFLFNKRCIKFREERVACLHEAGSMYFVILLFTVKNGPSPSISREDQICVQTHVSVPFLSVRGTENNIFLLNLNFQLWCCEEQLCDEPGKREETFWVVVDFHAAPGGRGRMLSL